MYKKIFMFIIILIVTYIFLLGVNVKGFSFWMDNNGLIDVKDSIENYLYAWNIDLLGSVNFTTYTSFSNYLLNYIFFNIFGFEYGYYFMYFTLISAILFIGYKINNIFVKDDKKSLFISIIFVFNLPFIKFFYGTGTTTFIIGALGFLLSLYFILKVKNIDEKKINYYLILVILSSLLVTHPFFFFFYYIIIFLILYFFSGISFKKIMFFSIILGLVHFFWIFQFLAGNFINYTVFTQNDYTKNIVSVFSANSQLYNSFIFLGKNSDYVNEFFGISSILIIIIYIFLWLIFFRLLIKTKLEKLSIILLSIILFLLIFSIGAREPLGIFYSYLYNNISFFSFFRTFNNVLLFCFYLFILFIIINGNKKIYNYIIFLNILFIVAFIFSINYYGYNKTTNIPNDYFAVKNIIDTSSIGKNVLLLPFSKYDYYSWDNGKQDKYFLDSFFNKSGLVFYRPTLSNNYILKNLFDNICSYNISIEELNKYGINYILLRKDLINLDKGYYKYFDEDNLNIKGINKKFSGKYLNLYSVNDYNKNDFTYISPIEYNGLINLMEYKDIILKNNYNLNWKIYLKDQQGFFKKPLFENTHYLVYDYANGWLISKNEIIEYVEKNYSKELQKEGYPKQLENGKIDYKYYILNPDGNIDVELTLYFKPQSYFYLGIIISGITFIILIGYLGVDIVRNRKNNIELLEKLF